LELQQLKHFIAAVDTKKLLTAAQVCEISQSGMSRSLGTLEETLGVRLLKRTAGGVEPTVCGQFLVPSARMIVSEIERCSREMRALKSASNAELHLGVTDNFCQLIIPILLDAVSAEFPEMIIGIRTGSLPRLMDGLQSGSVDCIIGLIGRVDEHPDFIFEQITRHQFKVIARYDHPLALGRKEISPAALSNERWATLDGDDFQRDFAEFFSSKQLPLPHQIMRTDSPIAIIEAVASNDLVTCLPPELIGAPVENYNLVVLDCDGLENAFHTTLARRKAHFMADKQIDVINRVKKLGATWFQY
jgi:LysR family transcriptional regulator of abg operon